MDHCRTSGGGGGRLFLRSLAVKASWTTLGLAFGCAEVFLMGQVVNQISPFAHSPRGLLTGVVPRAGLYVLWAGEIVARSLCGIAAGLFGTAFLWLVVGR
jgi:hypothetical protein